MTTLLAALAAIPFGWGLGVLAAFAIMGSEIGQMPIVTVPIAIVLSIVFALLPVIDAGTRLKIMLGGTVAFFAFGVVLAS